jgi:UPF0755 protein
MKKIVLFIIFFLILIIIFFSKYYVAHDFYNIPVKINVKINKGESLKQIAHKLECQKIVSNKWLFIFVKRILFNNQYIKSGEYVLDNKKNLFEIIKILCKGNYIYYKFTVPEGLNINETADVIYNQVNGKIDFDKKKFLFLCNNKNKIINSFGFEYNYISEGYLFPETYSYTFADNETSIYKMMLTEFMKQTKKLQNQTEFSFYEILIIASIVEKEAVYVEEQSKIAGVYINRLKKSMKLQADPTVIYSLGYHKKRLLYKDIEKSNSPYNTYKFYGLPPTPICSPGYNAIKNTINYEKHKYYYFVADTDGYHIFSKKLNEHNRNKILIKQKK